MNKLLLVMSIVASVAYAGWDIGSVTVKNRDVSAPAGYRTVSVEAVSGTDSGSITVYYVTMMPVTNTLATLNLSGGYATAVNSNVTFRSGDLIFATGSALTNGSAQVTVRR